MHPTLASHIGASDCVHFIRSWCIYSVVSWLIIFSVICIPIIHCALHGLVDDRCNLRRYNSSTFYNPYLCPLPTKPCISCTIATRVINNWTSQTTHRTCCTMCIVKTSLLIHGSMQSADTAVHLCAFRWRFLLQAPSLLQGTSISAPCLLLTCSSPHRMLPCKLLPCNCCTK